MYQRMQMTATRGVSYARHASADASQLGPKFRALFVLSGSKGVSPDETRKRLRLSEEEFGGLLHQLQMEYLVDVVSERRGEFVVEQLHLTEEGRSTLQHLLEMMCELPELE